MYFVDHGAPGLFQLPTGWFGFQNLYADELHNTIKYMHENKMYKEMVIYVEACESGSLFNNILEDDLKVLAVTAADDKNPSYANYCGPNFDIVNNVSIGSCLGDVFSNVWFDDTETAMNNSMMNNETLASQFKNIKQIAWFDQVSKYGDFSFINTTIG